MDLAKKSGAKKRARLAAAKKKAATKPRVGSKKYVTPLPKPKKKPASKAARTRTEMNTPRGTRLRPIRATEPPLRRMKGGESLSARAGQVDPTKRTPKQPTRTSDVPPKFPAKGGRGRESFSKGLVSYAKENPGETALTFLPGGAGIALKLLGPAAKLVKGVKLFKGKPKPKPKPKAKKKKVSGGMKGVGETRTSSAAARTSGLGKAKPKPKAKAKKKKKSAAQIKRESMRGGSQWR